MRGKKTSPVIYIHDRISRALKEHTQDLSNKKSNNQPSEGIHERADSSQNMKWPINRIFTFTLQGNANQHYIDSPPSPSQNENL